MPYLEAIGRKHGLDPFDRRVVEAYWLGNDLLDAFERRDFANLLDGLVLRGLPRVLAQRLAEHLPAHPIPHHTFHVGFVGVGNVTGHVRTTLSNMEACRPGWGEVVVADPGSLTLVTPSLTIEGEHLTLGAARREVVPYDPKVLPGVAVGEWVALHWHTPTLRLEPERLAQLRKYTELSLAAANEAFPGLGVFAPTNGVGTDVRDGGPPDPSRPRGRGRV